MRVGKGTVFVFIEKGSSSFINVLKIPYEQLRITILKATISNTCVKKKKKKRKVINNRYLSQTRQNALGFEEILWKNNDQIN